jgi:hypothetical protein
MAKRAKLSKPQTDERRDVTVKAVSVYTWRRARIEAMERGQTMAAFIEGLIESEVNHVSTK